MDGFGLPLEFSMTPGNEQTTLKPLEPCILKDFELSKMFVQMLAYPPIVIYITRGKRICDD